MPKTADADGCKGAFEPENPRQNGNTSLAGQLPHRTKDPLIKSADSDFPEPGNNPEHSGEKQEPADSEGSNNSPADEGSTQTQEPGHRQKRNQDGKKDDDLAA